MTDLAFNIAGGDPLRQGGQAVGVAGVRPR
jgi:hypothetical protein